VAAILSFRRNKIIITKIVGDEFDDKLKARLVELLKGMGGSFSNSSSAIAGSQEIAKVLVTLGSQQIEIESETFIGLSISGDQRLVEDIARNLNLPA
jgi:hypothetical protein